MNKYLQNVFRSLLCAIAIGLSLTPAFAYFCIWQWISPETNIEKILMIFIGGSTTFGFQVIFWYLAINICIKIFDEKKTNWNWQ